MIRIVQGKESDNVYWTCLDLLDNDFKKIFYSLCSDILNNISNLKDELEELNMIKDRISTWKIMFKKPKKPMNPETEQGLFGELYFIDKYMIDKYGIDEAIKSWSGPLKYNKDFSINTDWYEIKTPSVNSSSIKITSLSQLSSNNDGFLAIIRVEKMSQEFDDKSSSISDLIMKISTKITDLEIKQTFFNKLIDYGYDTDYSEKYNKFSVISATIYEVTDKFPKLTEKDIKYQEIDSVSYEIMIKPLERFKVNEL